MDAKEAELVNEAFISLDTNYNKCPGGKGGWDHVHKTGRHINCTGHTDDHKTRMSDLMHGREPWNKGKTNVESLKRPRKPRPESIKKKISESNQR